ncbi:STAS domain-containing protein [Desulfovibrio ferrophilus]|uniref:Anti-sigma factor antagonist n=1 Tax=Desulfovibrio ferrophilus TaxID=241368 RepID=A0A2Z6B057_9BACT|nr:STAS domain-containing protein [Desulfovibrio ferrophilus]BBD08907.1 anti-sigma factor antagonist [Desulfovibrio ferrophilus]
MENLRIKRTRNAALADYTGEMTLEVTRELRETIDAVMTDDDVQCLIFDLSGVSFIDSSGIGFLVSLASRVENEAKSFYLYRPDAQVVRTLELVQLKKYFKILGTEEELAPLML